MGSGLRLFWLPIGCLILLLAACGGAQTAVATPQPATLPTASAAPTPTSAPAPTPVCAPNGERPFTILTLGDSYTIGENVDEAARWPVQLVARLRNVGVAVAAPQIVAETGWTTADLSAALDDAVLQPPYDVVTLLIGVNNQFGGLPQNEYRQEFAALLQRAIDLARGAPQQVIVISIPDWGANSIANRMDRASISAEIDAFNAINRHATVLAGARYVDITAVSRRALTDPSLTSDDRLHPSSEMYAKWVDLIYPHVCHIFKNEE